MNAKPTKPLRKKAVRKNRGKAAAQQVKSKEPARTCILVLGMHRSGTSALTKVLNLLGTTLPTNILGANASNEAGHWEPELIMSLHEQLLSELGSSWDDWGRLDLNELSGDRLQYFRERSRELINQEYGDSRFFVLKEPRICRFAPFLIETLTSMGIQVKIAVVFRHPASVCKSLELRDNLPNDASMLLWLRYNLDAEFFSRNLPRSIISYDELLENWRVVAKKLVSDLAIEWPVDIDKSATGIEEFLRIDLNHNRIDRERSEHFSSNYRWINAVYATFDKAGNDRLKAEPVLNRVRSTLDEVSALGNCTKLAAFSSLPRVDFAEARANLPSASETIVPEQTGRNTLVDRARNAAEAITSLQLRLGAEIYQTEELQAEIKNAQQELANQHKAIDELKSENTRLDLKLRSEINQSARLSCDLERQYEDFSTKVSKLNQEFANYKEKAEESANVLQSQFSLVESQRDAARHEEKRLHDVVDAIYASTSWRITEPLRAGMRCMKAAFGIPNSVGRASIPAVKSVMDRLRIPHNSRRVLKNVAFTTMPFAFRGSPSFSAWLLGKQPRQTGNRFRSIDTGAPELGEAGTWSPERPKYVEKLSEPYLQDVPAQIIAFYLPQFHTIPENNEWWGEGFTEWTNVRPAKPQFQGHRQPRAPGELGYYDLRDTNVQHQQIDLARLYGVGGFCFYHYWFGGKRLLETPVEQWLADPSLDFPYCLCWANENWSRRWDGLDNEILIAQTHSPQDDLAFIEDVGRYLRDPRYIRIAGKPLLLVYRPGLLPDAAVTAARWRDWCRKNGIGEIHLAYTQSFETVDPKEYGFDSAVEFPPNNSGPPDITHLAPRRNPGFTGRVFDWKVLPERSENYSQTDYKLWRSVCPGWDNTARRGRNATIFANNSPELYRKWLENALRDTVMHESAADRRLIFVNAWNEWAEGAYLEPDEDNGYAYLQATRDALQSFAPAGRGSIVLVSHDAHPHGAQFLALGMVKTLKSMGFDPEVILLGPGPLTDAFAAVCNVYKVDLTDDAHESVMDLLASLRSNGASMAIANTTVSGSIVPMLKSAGFRTVSTVHEMPGVLRSMKLANEADNIVSKADVIVFAADEVRQGFEQFVNHDVEQALVLPQGLLRTNPYKGRQDDARRIVCNELGIAEDARIILSVAYVDERKGPDLLVEIAEQVVAADTRAVFVWIGHFDSHMKSTLDDLLKRKRLQDKVRFVGFIESPMAYYAASSVYALPSREDPFPNVVFEAAEVGVPTVAFEGATGAAGFIFDNGGRLAKRGDTGDFARCICELLESPAAGQIGPVPSMRKYLMDLMHQADGFTRVSVVVPNYNYAQYLVQRLGSIVGQTYPIYEIFILDDASTDNSREVIGKWVEQHREVDVHLHFNETNSGSVFKQWNTGIGHCLGDVVWIAEADDLSDPHFLETLVAGFTDEATVMAYSQSRQISEAGDELAPDYFDYTDDISSDWRADYVRDGASEIANALAVKNTIPNVSAVLFRRSVIESVMQELGAKLLSYRVAGDWLVYLTVLRNGQISYHSKSLNAHRRHVSSVTGAIARRKHYDEVAELQSLARSMVETSPETDMKGKQWLDHVRHYLGIELETVSK